MILYFYNLFLDCLKFFYKMLSEFEFSLYSKISPN